MTEDELVRAAVAALAGQRCSHCDVPMFPELAECPECGAVSCPVCGAATWEGDFCAHLVAALSGDNCWYLDFLSGGALPSLDGLDEDYFHDWIRSHDIATRTQWLGPFAPCEELFGLWEASAVISREAFDLLCSVAGVRLRGPYCIDPHQATYWYAWYSPEDAATVQGRLAPHLEALDRALAPLRERYLQEETDVEPVA